MKKILISMVVVVLVLSCTKKAESPNAEPTNSAPSSPTKSLHLKWVFKSLGESPQGQPITQVSLLLNTKPVEIGKANFNFSELGKESYKDEQIPAEALAACKGWWAGDGMLYWVVKEGKVLTVMSRKIGETMDNKGHPSDVVAIPQIVKSIDVD